MQVVGRLKTGRFVGKSFLAVYFFMYRKSLLFGIARKYFCCPSGRGEQDAFLF